MRNAPALELIGRPRTTLIRCPSLRPFSKPSISNCAKLEAVAARMRELDERELLDLYPQIAAVREALRALTEELERRV